MANRLTPHLPDTIEKHSSNTKEYKVYTKSDIALALMALDNTYKENIQNYANEIHSCTYHIEKLQNRLERLKKEYTPHLTTLEEYTQEVNHTLHLLEHLTQEWLQQSAVLTALKHELKDSKELHISTIKHREVQLRQLDNEIADIEIKLLEQELQKQNLLLSIEPKQKEICSIEQSLKDLESKKRFIESTYLHHLTPTIGQF